MCDSWDWSTPGAAGASLRCALRAGRFAEAYASLFSDLPLSRADLLEIGREQERARSEKSPTRRAAALNRLGVKLARRYLRNDGTDSPRLVELVEGCFESAHDQVRAARGYDAPYHLKAARIFGIVLAGVEFAIAHGALASDADRIADAMAELVPLVLAGEGLSVTDARNAAAYFTQSAPLTHWLDEPRRGAGD